MISMSEPLISGPVLYCGILLSSILFLRRLLSKLSTQKLPLPPGPKGLPILGNISDLPPVGVPEWRHWLKYKDEYGPICSVTVLGQTIIVIHDKDMASELLDKRSAKFSSRPFMEFASRICGYEKTLGLREHNDEVRTQRKLAARQLGSKNLMAKYYSAIEFQVQRFLFRTMNDSDGLVDHLQLILMNALLTHADWGLYSEAGSFILNNVYGYKTNPNGRDPLIALINQFMAEFSAAVVAGAWPVDIFTWIRYLPEWVPGVKFQAIARGYRKNLADATNIPFDFVERKRAEVQCPESVSRSYVSNLLDGLDSNPNPVDLDNIKESALSLYAGGADTTVASLGYFFLAMTLFPEVQRKAQEEIDGVVGCSRLPGFEDRENLPYVEAVLKETWRWMPIASLCLPHTSNEEDEFRGYRIPKGSIILPSIAWFARDPKTYSDPEQFKPERFLGPQAEEELDPQKFAFGFGRRICPGRYSADANMFLMIAQSLAVFDIQKKIDPATGKEIEPVVGQVPGIVSHPAPFECSITPRSATHRQLIEEVRVAYAKEEAEGGDDRFLHGLSS
ncbi:hypothetical protein Dda_9418 [Drechslerella dactyloides]|uniref:O-methylsterigmatocystin oxidoreductase n=1 Tax=Drechslerella dactyloides TaxID=74499 RepID=A0AAD6IPA5_DREDA|nr:hypothetical protein Dda_9418 [Drechslerella dactyloides]